VANWNLSVDIRGTGNDLARDLRTSATHARALGTAARATRGDVRQLGQSAQTATRHIRALGRDARSAARDVARLGSAASSSARGLARYGDAARSANRGLSGLGANSRDAGRDLARMSGQINGVIRDLGRLADAAQRAGRQTGRIGDDGIRQLRRYSQEAESTRRQLAGLATVLTGGAFAMGGAEFLKNGNEYQQAMNTFGAVTGATAVQMQRAAATANQLGNDLSLPGASATEAAESMVELAKAGFRTDQAISSTRASLQLASAAQVNAADSAKYLGDMMDQFGMGADQASVAADTLAATANSASGDIIDIYYSMKYAGPVAHGLGVSMQEAATGVGMLGKAGILGQTAGTTLRGIFTNLAKPTKLMKQGLASLGIEAWTTEGRFKGLRYIVEKLGEAEHHLSQKDFTAAVAKAFGKPAMSGAIALAHQGTDSYDALIKAVSDTGAAADIAAAKGKGLSGAMLQLKTQARQTGLTIYDGLAPGLEYLVRSITSGLSSATPKIEDFFDYLNAAATLFGPEIGAAAKRQFADIREAAGDMLSPFKELGGDAIAAGFHLILTAGKLVIDVLEDLVNGVTPVVSALGEVAGEGTGAATVMDLIVVALDGAATAAAFLTGILGPLGHLVGGLVSMFASLPGPIQTAVFAMLLMRRVVPMAQNLAGTVGGRLTGAFSSLNQQMALQRSLAGAAGQSISRYGAAFAVLQSRVPVIGQMGAAFRGASTQATGFAGSVARASAAAGVGMRTAMSGLAGAMGGPWGLALTGITVGLGILASSQQKASAEAAEHRANIDGLTTSLRESNGVITESVRQQAAQNIQNTKLKGSGKSLADVMGKYGYTLTDLTDAYLGQSSSVDDLAGKMSALAREQVKLFEAAPRGERDQFMDKANEYTAAAIALRNMSGDSKTAAKNARDLLAATKGTEGGASAYDRLKGAVAALADKTADADSRTRALRDALDLLSGGSVSLQAAQARVNEAISQANEAMAAGINQSDGWGDALVRANGQIDTTTKNGRDLFNTLNTISDSSASAAIAAYDFADSQGATVTQSVAAARKEMENARTSAIQLARAYDLDATQAAKVADSLGLIPGDVSILLQTKGVDTALAELLAVQAEFARMPKAKTIKVDALGAEAKKELEDIGYKIELIPGTREYKITAPTAAARTQLDLLIAKLAATNGKTVNVGANTDAAVADLATVQEMIRNTKGRSVTISALTATAEAKLKDLGFKVTHMKNGQVSVTVPTGPPLSAVATIQGAINGMQGKTVTNRVVTYFSSVGQPGSKVPVARRPDLAQGGPVPRYAAGGEMQAFPQGGYIRGPGTATSDSILAAFASGAMARVSNTEYVIRAAAVRKYGVGLFDALNNELLPKLPGYATGGPVRQIPALAEGGVTDWRYDPTSGSLYSPSDAANAARKTKKVTYKVKVKGKIVTKTKEIDYFDLTALEKRLRTTSDMTRRWNADLAKVADRVGGDVADALAAMGSDGYELTKKMANGSTAYINKMAASLRGLAATAKASLTDYTRQMSKATAMDAKFANNLATLAARGYGELAKQLAAQGDQAAMDLAASAVSDSKKAASANKAAKQANNALTADQVEQLVAIIAAVTSSKTGIHDVAATTGLGEDEIIAVASKASGQIKSSLGARAAKFLADLARANKGLSYADGGIREGIYATRGGAVTFAEPTTGGEAFIPLGANKRRSATRVLRDVANRFGVGLTDLAASQKVIVIRENGDTIVNVAPLRTGATASEIGAQVGWQMRRARRGGVNARA
jgi:TP901 family phage tail tape measure protein